jgi:hypothetical protein
VHENRAGLITQDQIKTANEFIDAVNMRIKEKMPKPEDEHREQIRKNAVIEKVSVQKVLYNKTKGLNNGLKVKVQTMR